MFEGNLQLQIWRFLEMIIIQVGVENSGVALHLGEDDQK